MRGTFFVGLDCWDYTAVLPGSGSWPLRLPKEAVESAHYLWFVEDQTEAGLDIVRTVP